MLLISILLLTVFHYPLFAGDHLLPFGYHLLWIERKPESTLYSFFSFFTQGRCSLASFNPKSRNRPLCTGSQKPPPLIFLNNSVKDQPNVVIFGTPRPEETRHHENLNMPASPRNCCRTALPCKCNKVIFQRYSRIIAKINGGGRFRTHCSSGVRVSSMCRIIEMRDKIVFDPNEVKSAYS